MKIAKYIFIIQITLSFISCDNKCIDISKTYENGNKKFVDVYPDCNNKNEFKRYIYFENGKLQNEGTYVNNLEQGTFKRWNRKGILIEKWEFINGIETGHVECWYPDGKKKKELYLDKGVENGEFKGWDENGELIEHGFYENGKQKGKWIFVKESGTKLERTYKNDTLTGETYEYIVDSSNIIHVIGQYKKGAETGLWKWFNEDSILYQTVTYKNGEIIEIKDIKID
jgi:antitoxin component YwqK of YwqJK toxin-antitoxin module